MVGFPEQVYNSFKVDDNTTSIIVVDVKIYYQSAEAVPLIAYEKF